MIPTKYLYTTDEFAINDLIRDAHPYGGTEVVSETTGEGIVEDIIEGQLKTLEMVFRQPTLKTLATLANDLDSYGLEELATQVDDLLSKVASEPVKVVLAATISEILEDVATQIEHGEELLAEYPDDREAKREAYFLLIDAKEQLDKASRNPAIARDLPSLNLWSRLAGRWRRLDRRLDGRLTDIILKREEGSREFGGGAAGEPSGAGTSFTPDDSDEGMSYIDQEPEKPKVTKKHYSETMKQVQTTINEILGKTVINPDGFVGDRTTWRVLKEHPFNLVSEEGKPVGYRNYSQLLSILEDMRQSAVPGEAAEVSTDVAKSREAPAGDKSKRPSRIKDKKETTHIYIDWYGKLMHIPITRIVRNLDVNNVKAMSLTLKLLQGFLRSEGIDVPSLDVKRPETFDNFAKWFADFIKVLQRGTPTDGHRPTAFKQFGDVFPRYISYFESIREYVIMMGQHIRDQEQRKQEQLAGAKNIFEFLGNDDRGFAHAKPHHPFYKAVRIPALRAELSRYFQSLGFADSQERMLRPEGVIVGAKPRIETHVKNLLRNYGIK